MTDPTSDPLDELASAHLDGAATPSEAERALADPEVGALVARFEAVRAAIRQPEAPPSDAAREAGIQAALAAFDAAQDQRSDRYDRSRRVVPLSARRLGRPAWARVVGVAAAAVLLAAVVPLLFDDDGDGGDEVAAELERGDSADDGAGGDAPGAAALDSAFPGEASTGRAAEGGDTLAATLAAPDLGPLADTAALVAAVRQELAATDGTPTPAAPVEPQPEVQVCFARAVEAAGPGGGVVVFTAVALLAGQQVAVVVVEDPTGARSVRALDPLDGCAVVSSAAL